MKRITFICTGNTCRSPMAEYVLRKKFSEAGIEGVDITSAGLFAKPNGNMNEYAVKALNESDIKAEGFKSKVADGKLLISSDLIICMTENHKRYISNYPNVYSVKEITGVSDIEDPFSGSLETYKRALKEIEKACEIIKEKYFENKLF